jgi:presequence protease
VRDPFFKMLPRSLQNFMNAFTSSDHTTYPFATTNVQDFRNLMSVYLDATLHPLLKQSDFVQEGWRIGPENPMKSDDSQGTKDLVFKGVVYNEMKGQMSDATYLYYIRFQEHIYPAINNSGGDPRFMTNLTYDQLKNFHKEHYHPSNAKIFTYGDQPVEGHLEMLGPELAKFEKQPADSEVRLPITLDGPKEVSVDGPFDPLTPPEAQYKTSTTWSAGDSTDIHQAFAMQLISSILTDGYGSPLYRALIESGLGSDFTPNTGYDSAGLKAFLTVGVNGVTEENVAKVKEAIAATFRDAAEKGFDQHKVDGLLHQLELSLKHKTAHLGRQLIFKLKPGWFNGVDPLDALSWNNIVDHFKSENAKGGYLEGLVKKYLLNDNTFTFTMVPNRNLGAEIALEEAERLKHKIDEAVKQYPSEAEAHKQLRDRELKLIKDQDAGVSENLELLPTLRVSEIPRQKPKLEVRDTTLDNAQLQVRETSTNGLTYFTALSLFRDLPDELRMLVPLFCDSLLRIGTKDKTMEELEDLIKLKTGGLSFSYHSTAPPYDTQALEEALRFGGYALDRNVPAMYDLLQTLLLETDFDGPKAQKMVKQLLQTGASGAVDGIASSGHMYAVRYAAAAFSPQARTVEQTAGLMQVGLITRLAAAEEDPEAMHDLIQKLKAIQALAVSNLSAANARMALICGAEASGPDEAALNKFLSATASANLTTPHWEPSPIAATDSLPTPGSKSIFTLPYQVSYTGLAIPATPYTSYSDSAASTILGALLTHKHLHPEIREKGGAYGSGAHQSNLSGTFAMFSYRDPNPENSLSVMRNALRWAEQKEWSERELEEAKLMFFQREDAPKGVNSEGMERFVAGLTDEMRMKMREAVLDVDAKGVKEAAERLQDTLEREASVVVLGEKKEFVKESEGWQVRDLGMGGKKEEEETATAEGEAAGTAA